MCADTIIRGTLSSAHPSQLRHPAYLARLIWSRALLPPQPYPAGQIFLLHPKSLFLLFENKQELRLF